MSRPKNHQLDILAEEQMAIQFEEAREVDAVWYWARIMCQLALPISKVQGSEFTRESGQFHLSVSAPAAVGLPYGRYPRGILNWLVTEIVVKPEREGRRLFLGNDLSTFMANVSGSSSQSGGETGNIPRFKRQLTSLLMSRILFWSGKDETKYRSLEVSPAGHLFWNPYGPQQRGLLQSWVEIGEAFWNDCVKHAVPVNIHAIRALWGYGCLAMDAYAWLAYKSFVQLQLGRPIVEIPWVSLKFQFGQQYRHEKKFKQDFKEALRRVLQVYDGFSVNDWQGKGLAFHFVHTPVPPKPQSGLVNFYPKEILPPSLI